MNSLPAATLDDELAGALVSVKGTPGGENLDEGDLAEIFEIEQKRVADAVVLAELLAPRLAQQLQRRLSLNPPSSPAPQVRPTPVASSVSSRVAEVEKPSGPPGIADLIDGMLDQERRSAAQNRRPLGR